MNTLDNISIDLGGEPVEPVVRFYFKSRRSSMIVIIDHKDKPNMETMLHCLENGNIPEALKNNGLSMEPNSKLHHIVVGGEHTNPQWKLGYGTLTVRVKCDEKLINRLDGILKLNCK